MDAEAVEIWKWIAGLFAAALSAILGLLAKAALEKSPKAEPETSWSTDRGEVRTRLASHDDQLTSLRESRTRLTDDVQALLLKVGVMERDVREVKEDVGEILLELRRRQIREGGD